MRQIQNKTIDTPPPILLSARSEQERIALEKNLGSISEDIYKGDKILITDTEDPYFGEEEFEIRYLLRRLFFNKCAYCERIEYKPDVEHYRPKKRVSKPQGNKHGYYWLCYEWTNLLPACSSCNSGNGKWNKFPIAGIRIVNPPFTSSNTLDFLSCQASQPYLLHEKPLLLHPEIDNPTNFFKLEWNGKLSGLDGESGRGNVSIEVYDLNRGNLIDGRKTIIDNLTHDVLLLYFSFRTEIIEASQLQKLLTSFLLSFKQKQAVSTEFSFVYLYVCQHFEEFIRHQFSDFSEEETLVALNTFQNIV